MSWDSYSVAGRGGSSTIIVLQSSIQLFYVGTLPQNTDAKLLLKNSRTAAAYPAGQKIITLAIQRQSSVSVIFFRN